MNKTMKTKFSVLLAFFVVYIMSNLALAQERKIYLKSDKAHSNYYEVEFRYDDNSYAIEKDGLIKKIKFEEIKSSIEDDIFAVPTFDIFVALPSTKIKKFSYQILETEVIPALPEFNKKSIVKENKILFSDETIDVDVEVLRNYSSSHIECVEYFWLGFNYCAHIKFKPVVADIKNKNSILAKNFYLRFYYDSDEQMTSSIFKPSDFIINKNAASKYQSKPKFYETSQNSSWIDFSSDYVKIGTAQDGIYRIYKNDLISLGVDVNFINPKTFQLILRGQEIPIYVKGEDDLSFDEGDYIEFVGLRNMGGNHRAVSAYNQPYNEYLDRYSDTTIYWLTWGKQVGRRAEVYDGSENISANDTLKYYHQVEHIEFNPWFDFSYADITRREMPFWTENKTWIWSTISAGGMFTYNLTLSRVYPNKTADLYFKGQSQASNITTNAHWVAINVNLAVNDTNRFNKYQTFVVKKTVPTSQLNNGNNILRAVLYNNGNTPNSIFVDWFELEYPRYPEPINGMLKLQYPYLASRIPAIVLIQNPNSSRFSIWKYGDGFRKYVVISNNNQIYIKDTVSANSFFLFSDSSEFQKPKLYGKKRFKNLLAQNNKADYIAITHKKFFNAVLDYCSTIEQIYNVKTITIDVEDIYDEFAFGFFNPESIKEFLKGTHTYWQIPVPKYVCLIGEASYDYHLNKTKYRGEPPVFCYAPSFGAPVSDSWYGMWNNQKPLIPQINIGRLPIREISELNWYKQKIIAYNQRKFDRLNKQFIMFSGGSLSSPAEITALTAANQYVIDNFVNKPALNGNAVHFYKTVSPITNFGPYSQEFINKTIDDGAIVISYIGHSGTQTWDNSITTVEQLENKTGIFPLISDFGCSTARFAEPDIQSFSELFVLHPRGQAIAYIGNSSLGYTTTAINFPKIFYEELLKNLVPNIVDAHIKAKERLLSSGSSSTYNLFAYTNTYIGDPIVNLKLPPTTNLNISLENVRSGVAYYSDNMENASFFVRYYNFGLNFLDTFYVDVKHFWRDSLVGQYRFQKITPDYLDSFMLSLPIKDRAGEHKFIVNLDADNQIDEIYEDDNYIEYRFVTASTKVRDNLESALFRTSSDEILFINPQLSPNNPNDKLQIDLSSSENFDNYDRIELSLDTFYTNFRINQLESARYYYVRAKMSSDLNFGAVKRFYKGSDNGYLLGDSLAFMKGKLTSLVIKNNKITFEDSSVVLSVLSAGYYDGRTANILLNKQQLIPENTLRGHHVILIDKKTLKFFKYLRFDVFSGGTNLTNYNTFLDTVSNKFIVAIAVSDEGSYQLNQSLRDKIKTLGSKYIDSLVFRGSWCIIGMKGLAPGQALEAFTKPYGGPASIETTYVVRRIVGSYISPIFDQASKWEKLELSLNNIFDNRATLNFFGYSSSSNNWQKLFEANLNNNLNLFDLSGFSSSEYTRLYFSLNFEVNDSLNYPVFEKAFLKYKPLPELGLNYQTVFLEKDTVQMRDKNKITIIATNASTVTAKNVKLRGIIDRFGDNRNFELFNSTIDSIEAYGKKTFSFEFNVLPDFGSGKRKITVFIDDGNKIKELYEDNNSYVAYFYIKPDTTFTSVTNNNISVLFDGKKINDGDFVSQKPTITIEIFNLPYWFRYSDTSAIVIFLNERKIYYSQMSITFDSIERKTIFSFQPTLNDGQHNISIFGININGQINSIPAYERTFKVESKFKVYNIINYPNPFVNDTYFTFELTQPADYVKIKIFTVAGRFLQEIALDASQISRGLNKVYWDGKDRDRNRIANGVYFYKIIFKYDGKNYEYTKKMAKLK